MIPSNKRCSWGPQKRYMAFADCRLHLALNMALVSLSVAQFSLNSSLRLALGNQNGNAIFVYLFEVSPISTAVLSTFDTNK